MFQFAGFAATRLWIQRGLIRVSRDHRSFVSSPRLFADFHALHRLLMPRHPPCALTSLTTNIQSSLRYPPPHIAARKPQGPGMIRGAVTERWTSAADALRTFSCRTSDRLREQPVSRSPKMPSTPQPNCQRSTPKLLSAASIGRNRALPVRPPKRTRVLAIESYVPQCETQTLPNQEPDVNGLRKFFSESVQCRQAAVIDTRT